MKTILRVTMLLVLGGLCAMPLAAQDSAMSAKPKAAKPAAKPKEQMGMPMPKPAPEMTKMIKMMGGNWTVAEKHDASPMMPAGTSKGTAVLTPGPAGMSLTEKYHSTGAMGSFNGLGTFWWDAKAQVYRGVWCDSMSPNGCDDSGTTKWEGDKLVGNMEAEMNGQKMLTRLTYSDFKSDSFVMTMESGPDASKLQKVMTITYTKTGGMAEKKKME
jgi:Protein of unknown function (DUF1579)